jgi:hypothetical protein
MDMTRVGFKFRVSERRKMKDKRKTKDEWRMQDDYPDKVQNSQGWAEDKGWLSR